MWAIAAAAVAGLLRGCATCRCGSVSSPMPPRSPGSPVHGAFLTASHPAASARSSLTAIALGLRVGALSTPNSLSDALVCPSCTHPLVARCAGGAAGAAPVASGGARRRWTQMSRWRRGCANGGGEVRQGWQGRPQGRAGQGRVGRAACMWCRMACRALGGFLAVGDGAGGEQVQEERCPIHVPFVCEVSPGVTFSSEPPRTALCSNADALF